MIKPAVFLGAILSLAFTATAQTGDDRAKLRDHLNLPASVLLVESDDTKLPAGGTLKVYIAVGKDDKAYKRYADWAREWNKQDGSKHGSLEVVSSLSDADVILARYERREFVPLTRTSVGVNANLDRATDRSTGTQIRTRTTALPIARYFYLIARTDDALVIVYDDVDKTHVSEYSNPDKQLFAEFKKRMKGR